MKTGRALLFAAAMAFALVIARPAAAQLGGFNLTDQLKDILGAAIPPYIGAVTIDPEEPAADEAVMVTASIATLPIIDDEAQTTVDEAFLYYSVDGGENWEEVEMDDEDDGKWTAEIEGQAAGTEVLYYVRALSDVGDFDVEFSGKEVTLDIGSSQAVELHSALNLGEDFEGLKTIIEDTDDAVTPDPKHNFQTIGLGYDDDNLYFRIGTEKKMDGGKLSPLDASAYGAILINLALENEWDANEESIEDFVASSIKPLMPDFEAGTFSADAADRFSVWLWMPMAKSLGALLNGMPPETILKIDAGSKDPVYNNDAVSSSQDGGNMDLTIQRDVLGPESNQYVLLTVDINVTGQIPDNIQGSAPDIAFPTFVKFVDHSYTVGD